MYPLVRELAVDGIPVVVSCRVLDLARQPYYRWLNEPIVDGQLDEAYLANAIHDAHQDDPEFGYRFLADEVRLANHEVSDRVVWRICRDNSWWSVFGKPKRSKGSKPGTPSHDDLVRRDFTADDTEPVVARRHRAPRGASQPCGGERTPPLVRRSERAEAEGSLNRGTPGRVDSSPDNDGTGQHCQMVWVRQARRKGVREEPAVERPSREPAARTWWIRAALQRTPARRCRAGNFRAGSCRRQGGHGECLRRNRGDVAGA